MRLWDEIVLEFDLILCCDSYPGCHQVAKGSEHTESESTAALEPSASPEKLNSDLKEEEEEQQELQETKTQSPSPLEPRAEDQVTC